MKRRSKAGSVKPRRKAAAPKRGIGAEAARRRSSSESDIARLNRELAEAREQLAAALLQQTARSEVLNVISSSPGKLQPVFDTILQEATRVCQANFGMMIRYEERTPHPIAFFGVPPAFVELAERGGELSEYAPSARVARTKQIVHVADFTKEYAYAVERHPMAVAGAEIAGIRTLLVVPMLKEGDLIGNISIYRQKVWPFTDKQIALVQNFAAQAVIAIENARLLNELRESLEQQTATADVLRVISSSPGELEPVFNTMLANATRLCDATFGILYLSEGDGYRAVAMHNVPLALAEARHNKLLQFPADAAVTRAAMTKQPWHEVDARTAASYIAGDPQFVASVNLGGMRTVVSVPILKDGQLIGVISIYRQEVHPFTDKQIELVKNFAAQAVIAIENARLLNELRESLDRQTATADILRVIAGTPEDSKGALDTIAETASRMFDAANVNFRRLEKNVLQIVSSAGPTVAKLRKALPDIPLEPSDPAVRAVLDNKQIPIEDRLSSLKDEHGEIARALRDLDIRSQVFTPLSREGKAIGVMIVSRSEVRPFPEHELELMKGFADQAVIAIENARLLSELRQRTADLSESLEQQSATSDVLAVISSSQGELKPVFEALLANAVRLCDARFGTLWLSEERALRVVALHNAPREYVELRQREPIVRPGPQTAMGRMIKTRQPVQYDAAGGEAYKAGDHLAVATVELAGARTFLSVPMLKEKTLVGAVNIYRQEVRPFTDKQIELVENFAAQAIIAIENARLLNELRERTEEVVKLNQQLEQRVADQVGEIERMGRLRRFLPPQVADLIVASGTEKQLESHRREITALFCDLRGFTGFSESSDPEDVMALLAEYHAAIGTIINKYSGTLERYAGDGVMVIFNDPVPVENPALQAVLMALEMRTAIGGLIEKWRDFGHDLGFGIGIAHGFATLGTIGFEGRRDYAAIGTVSNVASRLCDEAKPGQILISPRVRHAIDKAVTVESVGEFALKGIRRPMMAYNALEASTSKLN